MKKSILVAAVVLLGGGLWFAYSKKHPAGPVDNGIPERFIAKVERRDIDMAVEISGDVAPAFQLDVRPEVGGKIKALHVIAGQQVKEGDTLVEIDDRDLLTEKASAVTEIEGATLTVDKTRRNFERSKELFAAKLISQEVYDNLETDVAVAENGLVRAERKHQVVEDKLRKTTLVAPAGGTVLSVTVIEGQVVSAAASVNSGTSLMMIADLSRLLVETHVNQVDVAQIEIDQAVNLKAESLRGVEMEARISFVAPIASVKNNIKGFQVKAMIERPDPGLRPGMTVNMTIPISSAQEAVSVPIGAVFKGENDAKIVYVRNGDNTEKREVKIGATNLDFAEIKSGIKVGEAVLLIEPNAAAAQKRS